MKQQNNEPITDIDLWRLHNDGKELLAFRCMKGDTSYRLAIEVVDDCLHLARLIEGLGGAIRRFADGTTDLTLEQL